MSATLTKAELAVCERLGVSPEDYAEHKRKPAVLPTNGLSDDERRIAAGMGIDPINYLAAKGAPADVILKERARVAWIRGGGDVGRFDAAWPSLRADLARQGVLTTVVAPGERRRLP